MADIPGPKVSVIVRVLNSNRDHKAETIPIDDTFKSEIANADTGAAASDPFSGMSTEQFIELCEDNLLDWTAIARRLRTTEEACRKHYLSSRNAASMNGSGTGQGS
eukprot:Clim_evm49s25 gene=Clim_evmTU49s25